jgi:hypothetical protein
MIFRVRLALLTSLIFLIAVAAATAQMVDPATMGPLCTAERGEMAPESTDAAPVMRFAVTGMQQFSMSNLQRRGIGYLYVGRDRIRFSPGAQALSILLDVPRVELKSAGEWTVMGRHIGMAQFDFRTQGKWMFQQLPCSIYAAGATPQPGDPRLFQDLLAAMQDFDAALARVKAIPLPASKPAAPAMAAAPATGSLKITAKPAGAQVYIDDHFRGATSEAEGVLIVDGLAAGKYKVRVSNIGYQDWSGAFPVDAGKTAPVSATLIEAGPKPLGVSEIVDALQNGIPKTRIIGFVNKYGVDFALDNENEQRLRNAGADSDLLLAVAKNKK